MQRRVLLAISCFSSFALATDNETVVYGNDTDGFDSDPYLAYQPEFARSLPVQILITGIMLTLCCILILNLLFTYSYHWPLSRLNYGLQLAGVSTMLMAFITSFHVILTEAAAKSQQWPYMLEYIAIDIPPDTWSNTTIAWWYGILALSSGLVHVTHIQFLTILYPSNLEAKLILILLAPLAVTSAIAELIPMHSSNLNLPDQDPPVPNKLLDVSDFIQNICNMTLSLLYTLALALWGFLVNRGQAWRTDGGTAAFGGAALLLATVSTVLSVLRTTNTGPYIWLSGTMHTVVLWQNFAGWWWWVGAGSSDVLPGDDEKRERKGVSVPRKKPSVEKCENTRGVKGDLLSSIWKRRNSITPARESRPSLNRVDSSSTATTVTDGNQRVSDSCTVSSSTDSAAPKSMAERISSFWLVLTRAHRHAVRIQALERIRLRSSQRTKQSPLDTSDVAMPGTSPFTSQEGNVPPTAKNSGTGIFWWGPFGRWRFRDRTTFS